MIPTYRRPHDLHRALESLEQQRRAPDETIVVDNAVDPVTEEITRAHAARSTAEVYYVAEPQLGLHNARHAGARKATGDVLVYTDDDATFAPNWLGAFARAFSEHPEMAAAGGAVLPDWEEPPPGWLLDLIEDETVFPPLSLITDGDAFRLSPRGVFAGVNMAIRRDALFALGGFNPDSFGQRWFGDGESGLIRKLWGRNMLIGFVPEATVYHYIQRSRMTKRYLRRRQVNEGAAVEYAVLRGRSPTVRLLLARALRAAAGGSRATLVAGLATVVARDATTGIRWQLRLSYFYGRLRYLWAVVRDAETRRYLRTDRWLTD